LTEETDRDGSCAYKVWCRSATSMALFLEKVQALSRIGDFLRGSRPRLNEYRANPESTWPNLTSAFSFATWLSAFTWRASVHFAAFRVT